MASSCGMLATCSMDGATSAMELGSVHQDGIAAIDELLREAERSRDPAEAHRVVRQSIAWIVASKPFREFIRTTKWADGQQWPVAVISADRAREFGFPEKAHVVRVGSKGVDNRSHQDRWSGFDAEDWHRIQRMVDAGESKDEGEGGVVIWGQENGKWWKVVFKYIDSDMVFLKTVHRIRKAQAKNLGEK